MSFHLRHTPSGNEALPEWHPDYYCASKRTCSISPDEFITALILKSIFRSGVLEICHYIVAPLVVIKRQKTFSLERLTYSC